MKKENTTKKSKKERKEREKTEREERSSQRKERLLNSPPSSPQGSNTHSLSHTSKTKGTIQLKSREGKRKSRPTSGGWFLRGEEKRGGHQGKVSTGNTQRHFTSHTARHVTTHTANLVLSLDGGRDHYWSGLVFPFPFKFGQSRRSGPPNRSSEVVILVSSCLSSKD